MQQLTRCGDAGRGKDPLAFEHEQVGIGAERA